MPYFSNPIGAERYERFRPKVHAVALEWLAATTGSRRYRSALDVACGTGESTKPLLSIAELVEGVDTSIEMVSHARAKGLQVCVASYDNLPPRDADKCLVELAHENGIMPIRLDRSDLIGYLTTQSNVESKIQSGSTYESIERKIEASMPKTTTSEFRYAYSYTIASFTQGR